MNVFKRTASGLNNQHLFHNVDLVVFVEGGCKSFNKQEVYDGSYHSESEDIIYWRNIFSAFKGQEKIKFKSIGSKAVVKEIAIDIIDGSLQTVMVAMDKEFDDLLNNTINHPSVLYTYGYSYENDIWNVNVIKLIIEELAAIKIENDDIDKAFEDFLASISNAVVADAYLFSKSDSFFPRTSGYLFCVDFETEDLPKIILEQIEKRLSIKNVSKQSLIRYEKVKGITTDRHCFGHFLADFSCQIILQYLKKQHSLIGPRKDILYRMGLNKFFQNYFNEGVIYAHHQNQLVQNK